MHTKCAKDLLKPSTCEGMHVITRSERTICEHLFYYFASVSFQYETLVVFDTSQNKTIEINSAPQLYWKGMLPKDKPILPDTGTLTHMNTQFVER